ncbi:hypothetical protein Pla52o_40370 [Novipirellula galeiformis]|uniref:Uncharacterized protein n=1 Tax=Novipirellula galeiformis TaxID=2528004 RepID=A0A5C6CA98_9BACT|nr:hypothetical protein [Novipirellula galeiformis]TWU21005.1 hypothetical protein Pla52o_40370 [Novipirellula galeiformis]
MIDSFGLSQRPDSIPKPPPPHKSVVQEISKSRLTQQSEDRVADSPSSDRPRVPSNSGNTAVELVNQAVELQQQLAAGYIDILM